MKVLVAGVGGIGGWLAASLARGGADVELFARGAALAKLQRDGLTIVSDGQQQTLPLKAFGTVSSGQSYDLIIVCVKTQDFGAVCESLRPVLKPGVRLIAGVNGLPWWFLASCGSSLHLEALDPGGKITSLLGDVAPLGAVVHASAHAIEPGVVRVVKADRLIIGEPDGRVSDFVQELSRCLQRGCVAAPIVPNIGEEIWAKLWGNMNMNPVSALTRLSSLPILERADLRALVLAMMEEFDAIGRKLGLRLPMSANERIEITKVLGDFRTSMLADAEAQRRLEHEGILGCVVELAEKLGLPAPVSKTVYALLTGLDYSFERNKTRLQS